jgi:hypothetical protein
MITEIITQLKTGTYKNVYARYDGVKNLVPPYVLVWEDARLQTSNGQANTGFFVSLHMVRARMDDLNSYMNNELITLLHKETLTETGPPVINFRLLDTNELSPLIEDNDDQTISRDRLFILPVLGSV